MKMKLLLKITTVIVIISLLTSLSLQVFATTEADKAALNEKINQAKSDLNSISSDKKTASSELDSLNDQVQAAQNAIADLKSQISEFNDKISQKEKDIAEEEKEIDAKNKLLQERMVALYEAGDTSYLDVLLNSEDLIDFISGYNAIQTIVESDTELINELEDKKTQLETDKTNLETDKKKVEDLKNEQEIKSATLLDLQNKKEAEVSKLTEEQKAKQSELDEYDKQMVKVNEDLARAYREAQEKINSGSNGLNFDGSFIWPCVSKTVTSGMKRRWGRWHKGIDINASFENVYAAASGYAYNATNPGGYGTYVIVIHGGGYVTLYGHLSSSHISNGQYVKQGQVIATSGNSGNGVTHLHFEIRKATSFSNFFGDNWLNPLDYLPGGYNIAAGALTPS